MYVGLQGKGKTLSMVHYLEELRAKYPGIQIYTNFGYKYQTGEIKNLDDFLTLESEKGIVFAVDEVQLTFQARQYSKFPPEMIFVLTQNRKFRKHFVCTAQLFEHVDKVFRDLTNEIVDCSNITGRWFFNRCYHQMDYRRFIDPLDVSDKVPMTMWRKTFFATDRLYEMYNTSFVVKAFQNEVHASAGEGPAWAARPPAAAPREGSPAPQRFANVHRIRISS